MYRVHRQARSEHLKTYFNRPYLEMITIETDRMEYWMIAVMAIYEEEAKADERIQTILVTVAVEMDDIHLRHRP